MKLEEMTTLALGELGDVLTRVDEDQVEALVEMIAAAGRVATYGAGREGLMMKALCMRLLHLGIDAHVVGDMTTPPVGPGDLFLVSVGPGYLSTAQALVDTAKAAKANTACFTAEPDGRTPRSADQVVVLPAQTMARDQDAPTSCPWAVSSKGHSSSLSCACRPVWAKPRRQCGRATPTWNRTARHRGVRPPPPRR